MASNTKKTKMIRKHARRRAGRERSRRLRKEGSTPVFPIHPEQESS